MLIAILEVLILGKSRKALEILRLAVSLKIKQKLEKKYKKTLQIFDQELNRELPHESSNKVWFCWFQGIENAPAIVRKCYQSICNNLTDREIVVLTLNNLKQYVKFPDYIMKKWKSGQITHTHFTDLLRLELLISYGGMWIDATVLCTAKQTQIPDYYFDSDLFFYQCLKPGRDGQSQIISSWLMSARTNNIVLMAVRCLCYEYWQVNTKLVDYFLLHDFMSIVLEYYPEEWRKVVPRDNAAPHILLLRLFEEYDEKMYKDIIIQSPFHKLSYKFTDEDMSKEGTYYDWIMHKTDF